MAQINKPTEYFNTKLYTGNASTQSITGINFQSDMVWTKARSGTYGTQDHAIIDVVRGVTKTIRPNQTTAEGTETNTITSFDTDGYTIGGDNGKFNQSSTEYVSWNWLADNTSGASNTDGSITSTVSANTTSGFSIVKYTGNNSDSTIGHGLGQKPDFIMIKELDSSSYDWVCYHKALGASSAIALNLTDNSYAATGWNNGTEPTSTVFSVDSAANSVNKSGSGFIAYCFAEKKGFSKFGKLQAIGENSNVFVYTGFKPAFVIIKSLVSDTWSNWYMFDNKRDPDNLTELALYSNLTTSEDGYGGSNYSQIDMLSNGFKIRRDGNWGVGGAAQSSIYIAFAEQPLVGTNNTPATAR